MLQEQIIKNFNIYNYKDYFTKTFLWQKVFCSNFAKSFFCENWLHSLGNFK